MDDAEKGINPGGTGFLVGHGGGIFNRQLTFYAVTNWHVACSGGNSIIRINRPNGGVQIIELDPSEWQFIPYKSDIAVVAVEPDIIQGRVSYIPEALFAEQSDVHTEQLRNIFVGDDTFMIGMFFDHQARNKNISAARFGHISMLPDPEALVKQETEYRGQCFVVDMHSRTGFSGSPVFAFRTFGSDLGDGRQSKVQWDVPLNYQYKPGEAELRGFPEGRDGMVRIRNQLKLIGIQCGQFPELWPVKGERLTIPKPENVDFLPHGEYIDGVSGMTCVIPAWEVMEVLNLPVFQDLRAKKAQKQTCVSLHSCSGESHRHREDLNAC